MPYFIYAVRPFAQLDQLAACATFPEASRQARALRSGLPPGEPRRIRIMFAETALEAEDLLLQVRDAPPEGDD
ncbi:MAG: hypothetical protein HY854_09710 [Burkholderiales bacterium]|nr:hypothetical protein [Burkholderiales bacterium]